MSACYLLAGMRQQMENALERLHWHLSFESLLMPRRDFQLQTARTTPGVREAGACLRGDKRGVTRVDRIDPDSVAVVRTRLKLSQSEFARLLGISVDTLQNWEQGRRQPSGAARVLLRVAAKHPEVVLEAVA